MGDALADEIRRNGDLLLALRAVLKLLAGPHMTEEQQQRLATYVRETLETK
jgi:hypothetical protein